ncbi:hypothetical protein IGI04_034910 [Brassica rapa subsp. trilocularis]|uniref:RNase H type-1 domain-containing protein n=1 Tax=Brassica rapa subsp. trilocularis TaxID=1813537 RepID=A0ABQ7LCW3_BRACM|nr:hypothetical protein IGI04_034910 [Brassica rapa subsp. trilocularis]
MGSPELSSKDLKVADLFCPRTKEWNKELIQQILPHEAPDILCIKPSTTGASDTYSWTLTSNGDYSTKSEAQEEIPQPSVQQTTPKQQMTATILINTDAAWKEDTKTAGLAWIFYDNTGKQLQQGSSTEEWVNSPLTSEALAIREALSQA